MLSQNTSCSSWKRSMEGCTLTIDLEREEEVYYGGQLIKGSVRIENKSNVDITGKLAYLGG